jgi:FixJ family two-component response regulator
MQMHAMRAGATDFLAKPFDDEALLKSVRAALEN